jgi:DNA-binding transcriptional LysR family regulator
VNALKGAPWQFVNKKGGFETIKVNGRYRVNSGEMAGRAAISGVGFAILSKQACQPYIDDGRLIEIEFEQSAAPCNCSLCIQIGVTCRQKQERLLISCIRD